MCAFLHSWAHVLCECRNCQDGNFTQQTTETGGDTGRDENSTFLSSPPPKEEVCHSQDEKQFIPECNKDPINYKMFFSPMYLSTLMNNRCRHEALRNTSVRKMVLWHNSRPYCRLGPYFWVMAMRGKMTTPTGKSAKARLTIKALVAERSFLLITTASMTKPFPEERRLWQQLQKSGCNSIKMPKLRRQFSQCNHFTTTDIKPYGFSHVFLSEANWIGGL